MNNDCFMKYPHIDNIDTAMASSKFIDIVRDIDNEAHEHNWIVTEKIDGANISIIVTPSGYNVARRTAILNEDERFYNITEMECYINNIASLVMKYIMDHSDKYDSITLFGEYYGRNIQNRIFYGNSQYFRFYTAMYKLKSNPEPLFFSFCDFEVLMHTIFGDGYQNMVVPIIARCKTFKEAMSIENDSISQLTDTEHNSIMEGTVIRPLHHPEYNAGASIQPIVKNKNLKFIEKANLGILIEDPNITKINRLKLEFRNYCVENRMMSVFSKLGIPESMKDIGKYVISFIEDAKEDFVKEYPEFETLDTKEQKLVLNIGSLGFILFKKCIANNNASLG